MSGWAGPGRASDGGGDAGPSAWSPADRDALGDALLELLDVADDADLSAAGREPGELPDHVVERLRVERPEDLARYVLRGYPEWDAARIRRAMDSGNETHVKLKEKIPVHIVYFTVWVDDQGVAHFLPDPYKRDRS